MPSNIDIAAGAVGAVAKLIKYIAESMGKTTAELLKEIQADCDARAKDPTDDSDKARKEIDADLPGSDR